MKGKRGFTLLEMIVATTIMGIAVAGLMSGISSSTRNAARLRIMTASFSWRACG